MAGVSSELTRSTVTPGELAGEIASRSAEGELARYYDLDLRDDPGDLDLYLALAARARGPVLELACGTGRLAVPLAEAGHLVTGVDLDEAMLDRARQRWSARVDDEATGGDASYARVEDRKRELQGEDGRAGLELVAADLVDVDLGPRFAFVLLALNGLLLLADVERQAAALRSIARHLRPGGLAAVDVWLPGPDDLALYDGRLILEWVREDRERDERVAKMVSASFDPATAVVELHALFDAWPAGGGVIRRVARHDRLRLVTATELVRLGADAGLDVEALGGDYALTPFGAGSDRVLFVGRLV